MVHSCCPLKSCCKTHHTDAPPIYGRVLDFFGTPTDPFGYVLLQGGQRSQGHQEQQATVHINWRLTLIGARNSKMTSQV
jgi:hypothetical protein